jgi:hypothetical protein
VHPQALALELQSIYIQEDTTIRVQCVNDNSVRIIMRVSQKSGIGSIVHIAEWEAAHNTMVAMMG